MAVVQNAVTWYNFQSKLEKIEKIIIFCKKFHPKQISYTFLKKVLYSDSLYFLSLFLFFISFIFCLYFFFRKISISLTSVLALFVFFFFRKILVPFTCFFLKLLFVFFYSSYLSFLYIEKTFFEKYFISFVICFKN